MIKPTQESIELFQEAKECKILKVSRDNNGMIFATSLEGGKYLWLEETPDQWVWLREMINN